MSEPALPPPPPPQDAPGGLPWEERAKHGALNAFVETVKSIVTAPIPAFARARRQGDLISPFAYAVLVGWLGVVVAQLWHLAMGTSLLSLMSPEVRRGVPFLVAATGFGLAFTLVLAPIFILLGLFIWGAIVHLFLMLFGGTKDSPTGFEGTLRVLAWSTTAQLAQVVPFAGGLIALVWGIALQTLGLASFHRTSHGRALAAVLAPILFCCVCAALLIGFIAAGAFTGLMHAATHSGP